MRIRATPALLVALAVGCSDTLTVEPINEVPADRALVDAPTARAALAGAYDAIQDDVTGYYYGADMVIFGDLPSDDVEHVGTFGSYLEADQNQLRSDNGDVGGMWDQLYEAINRANIVISRVPGINDVGFADCPASGTTPAKPDCEKDDIVGQAHFLRALSYHNLVKFWGGVPLRLEPVSDPAEAAKIARATVEETYARIIADLDEAKAKLSASTDPTRANRSAVEALRSRVLLFRGDWAGVITAATAAETGHTLATNFASLFSSPGTQTPEDIFKIIYTLDEGHSIGWYYRAKTVTPNGRYEVAPTCGLVKLFDAKVDCSSNNPMATFAPTDARALATVARAGTDPYGSKWPTGAGDEDLHVIRLAEVILNRAEALAQLDRLPEAVTQLNRIRARAGTPLFVLTTQSKQEVLQAIWNERRLELAFEGFRWPDLVRTGQALAALGLPASRAFQLLFPIPQGELDVSPNMVQNPGY